MTGAQSRDLCCNVCVNSAGLPTKSASLVNFLLLISLAFTFSAIYFYLNRPTDNLDYLAKDFMIKNIPSQSFRSDSISFEGRDFSNDFQTSYLPAEKNHMYTDFVKQDKIEYNIQNQIDIKSPSQLVSHIRVKRNSYFTNTEDPGSQPKTDDEWKVYEEDDSAETEEYESDSSGNGDEDENIKNLDTEPVHPVDRGPLDDVVDHIRDLPELEEGEMPSALNIYKLKRQNTVFHAFWKHHDDVKSIRTSQAQLMRQFMDVNTDPCHDFYQFACGKWANHNPIPADKAGYDTFEILRENLDTALKEILDFKAYEYITSSYPGQHLDIDSKFFQDLAMMPSERVSLSDNNYQRRKRYPKTHSSVQEHPKKKKIASEIMNRRRRYLKSVKLSKSKIIKDLTPSNNRIEAKRRLLKRNEKRFGSNKEKSKFIYPKKHRKQTRSIKDYLRYLPLLKDDPANGDAALKAKFLFKSCMNYDILQKRGNQPLLDLLDILGGWPILNPSWDDEKFDWLGLTAQLRLFNNDILISEWVGPDIKNSDEFVVQFDQTSLGLPSRDYYLQPSNKLSLDAYQTYIRTVALWLGGPGGHVKISAEKLINFEISLAKITTAPEERRNVSEIYKRMPLYKLEELVPEIDWRRYLNIVMNRNVDPNETVVLFALGYIQNLVQLIKETDSETLSNYLLWRFVRHRVNNLDDRFQLAKQRFYYTLFGREQSPPRWKTCISQVNSNMGMALGSMFVRKYFDETSKNDTLTMTREIQESFQELLQLTDWLDEDTKILASEKVDAMILRIGYPDYILNQKELDEKYKEVHIHPDKYFENILNILQHLTKAEQSRIGEPVNKTQWNTAPAVVNAYYSRNKNQIMFPAGILQPPFYHRYFPRALNYGGIGVVIGHEITHGFDDKGRLFDKNGNLHRWWSDKAIEAFHKRAQCLIDQYGQYQVPEVDVKVNGINTQGENIADNGGVKQSFRAYKKWLKRNVNADESLPGLNLTNTQLFFLNFAQVWCGAMRPEAMRHKLKTAVHSPGRFRVIGTLSNSEDFAREFQCPLGSPMNPKTKCSVW